MTTEGQIMDGPMNPWFPCDDKAHADRLYRVVGRYRLDGWTLEAFILKNWTLTALIDEGYVEAIPAVARPKPSDITQAVVEQILARDAHGQHKYGVSLDRTDLSVTDWLQHMAEEMMDGAHYALAAKREVQRAVARAFDSIAYTSNNQHDRDVYWAGMEAMRDAVLRELSK